MTKVLVFGTFDGLHPGHIDFFCQAKKLGDYLIVVVARDFTVQAVKGHAPKQNEVLRLKKVSQNEFVNEAILGNETDPYQIIKKIQPDIIGLGYDQQVFTKNLEAIVQNLGVNAKIVRFQAYKPKIYHSSLIDGREAN